MVEVNVIVTTLIHQVRLFGLMNHFLFNIFFVSGWFIISSVRLCMFQLKEAALPLFMQNIYNFAEFI